RRRTTDEPSTRHAARGIARWICSWSSRRLVLLASGTNRECFRVWLRFAGRFAGYFLGRCVSGQRLGCWEPILSLYSLVDSLFAIPRCDGSSGRLFRSDCFAAWPVPVGLFARLRSGILSPKECGRARRVVQYVIAGNDTRLCRRGCILFPVGMGNHGAFGLLPGEFRA